MFYSYLTIFSYRKPLVYFCFCGFTYSGHFISTESYTCPNWSFLSVFFQLAYCFQSSFIQHLSVFIFFLWLTYISLYGYTPHFVWSSVDGHLVCFHFFAIMNNVAMNIEVQILVKTYVLNSLGYIPGMELLNQMATL